MTRTIVIGSRGSALALRQAELIRTALEPEGPVQIRTFTTQGDRVTDRPISAIGDPGLFVRDIEDALREGRIDLAVHSAKDLPTAEPDGLRIAAIPEREDARDVLASRRGPLASLPVGAVVGTSSARRTCQLRALRPDLVLRDIRGNVDTRLRKLHDGEYDAILLAAAGLHRLGLHDEIAEYLAPTAFVPAPAQGALAVQIRAGDAESEARCARLDHGPTRAAIVAERAFLSACGGGCSAAVGAHATHRSGELMLRGMIGAARGACVSGSRSGPVADAVSLGRGLAEEMMAAGGSSLLAEDRRER